MNQKKKSPKGNTLAKSIFSLCLIMFFAYFAFQYFQKPSSIETIKSVNTVKSICLDPGHGADDDGASNQGITEKAINLTVAKEVNTSLEEKGYRVYMTRTTNDSNPTNSERAEFCNAKKASILVSIHHNYFDDTSVDYASALFYKDSDKALANAILNSTSNNLNLSNSGLSSFEDSVLTKSTMPAVVSEAFFITNDDEYNLLSSSSDRLSKEAQSIVEGINNYFKSDNKTSDSQSYPTLERNDL